MILSGKENNLPDNTWLLLGFIHDAIARLSQSQTHAALWENVCRDIRWVLPVERNCIVLYDQACYYKVVKAYEKGILQKNMSASTDPMCQFLSAISKQTRIKWRETKTVIDKFFSNGLEATFDDWLLASNNYLFSIPLRSKNKNIGVLLATLQPDLATDKFPSYISACSIYAQHICINYELIKTQMLLRESNKWLEATQNELKKQLIATKKEHEKVKELMVVAEDKHRQLIETNNQLVAQEEELRMNAEELKTVNSHLERTQKQLEKLLQEEKDSKRQLQETQSQLIQAEKMASLGEMTAGIAHEINNPLNFITGGAQSLQLSIQDLMIVLEQFELLESTESETEREQIKYKLNQFKEEYAFVDLKKEIELLLGDIKEGSNRAIEVIRSLRNFSRLDEHELKMADVHEGLRSSLVILNHRIDDAIIIHKKFDPELPEIECHLGQLNQVFLNILSNAIDALEEQGQLSIFTHKFETNIQIIIEDTGVGISPDIKSKIFDPFFTTKDVGKGTGLGLSISYGIIEKHCGSIEVESDLGKGSRFIITLPRWQREMPID